MDLTVEYACLDDNCVQLPYTHGSTMHRFKHTLLISAALSAFLLLSIAEFISPDMHNPLGVMADTIASEFTPAPSLLRAGSDRAALALQIYRKAHLVLALLFAACLDRLLRQAAWRSTVRATLLIAVQMLAAAATLSSLAYLVAAQLPVVLPLRRALAWLAAQFVLRLGIGLWMILGTGLLARDGALVRALMLLGVELGICLLAFAVSHLVMRERRARLMLAASHAELLATQALLAGAVRASERLRIARDLHDAVGHHLTALNLHLDLAVRQSPGTPAASLQTARELGRALLAEVRVVVAEERRGEPIDLRAALTTLCAGIPDPAVTLEFETGLDIGWPPLAHAVFCCVQEGLSNAMRHARATTVTVRITQGDRKVLVHIADDGVGSSGAPAGSGLAGMRERAAALGGTMQAADRPGRGYAVSIALPFAGTAA